MCILRLFSFWLGIVIIIMLSPLGSQAASIQGKIVDAETDAGVRCPAYFYSGGCGSGYEGQAWSDSDGYFQKDDLPDDVEIYIKMVPGNAGHTAYINEYYDGAPTCATAISVDPNNLPLEYDDVDDPESGQIFKLKLHHPTGGGTIRGRVTYHGSPLVGLQVQAYTGPCSGYISYGKTNTDTNGYYVLEHMPSGNIYMKACPTCTTGFEQTNQWWTDQSQNTEGGLLATAIVVSEGSEHNNIDFVLTSGASISGTLLDGDGYPLTDSVVVHAYKDDPCNGVYVGGAVAGYFGSVGTYTIDQLPAGTIYVRTDCNNRPAENYVETYYDGNTGSIRCQDAVAIELGVGQSVSGIDITVPVGGIIQGQILSEGEPVGRTMVHSYFGAPPDTGGHWLELGVYTEDDGTFTVKHIPEGDVTLFVVPPAGFENVWWSNSNPVGVADWLDSSYLEVFPEDLIEGVDFSLIFHPDLDGDCDVDGNDLSGFISPGQSPVPYVVNRFAEHFGSIDACDSPDTLGVVSDFD